MLDYSNWLKRTPNWVWWSCLPIFGGLAIAYAGRKANFPVWVKLGLAITGVALILSSSELGLLVWLAQIGTALYLRKKFLIKTAPKGLLIGDRETAQLIAETHGTIDINNCSKDDLVYQLGLPIVYANDIDSLRNEGYIFTHLEELGELIGIPENYLTRLAPLVSFSYDINKEADKSWRKVNSLSVDELIACNIDIITAQKIIRERSQKGPYKSLVDLRNRTGLPLNKYRHLL